MSRQTILALQPPKDWSGKKTRELGDLLSKANVEDPEPEVVEQLRALVRETPELWRQAGDLASLSQWTLAGYVSESPVVQEGILMIAKELRSELERPTDTALEKLVIEQCVSAYILHYSVELRYTAVREDGFSCELGTYWEKRLNASQMRYFRAMETLARLRRMALPALQINIGANQTNIAAGGVVNGIAGGQNADYESVELAQMDRMIDG